MFEQTFVQSQAKTGKPWTVAVSLSLQCGVVAIILLIPLLHPEKLGIPELPKSRPMSTWVNLQPLPIQETHNNTASRSTPAAPRPFIYMAANTHTAAARSVEIPSLDTEASMWSGPSTASLGPGLAQTAALPPRMPPPPPASPAPKPVISGPIKVSEGVQGARLTFGPHPSYPQIAIVARSQGIVKLEAMIATDGSIRNLRVLNGPPLLVNAALEAVRQWRYQPTLLNGVAVEVVTEIEVNFTLNR